MAFLSHCKKRLQNGVKRPICLTKFSAQAVNRLRVDFGGAAVSWTRPSSSGVNVVTGKHTVKPHLVIKSVKNTVNFLKSKKKSAIPWKTTLGDVKKT